LLTAEVCHAQQSADPSDVWLRDDGNARAHCAMRQQYVCHQSLDPGYQQGRGGRDRLIMSLLPKSPDTLSGTAFDAKRERT
jgi:uncharacterized protein (DUF2147 family)